MSLSLPQRIAVLSVLVAVIFATRIGHFAALPDASWAVFFLGGFYLRGSARFAFPLLMTAAVVADWVVISSTGQSFWSHYCVSPAYWFLLPSYLGLWAGGWLLSRLYQGPGLRELALLSLILPAAVSLCFLLSNGSFYWLSPVVTEPTWSGWMANLGHWYLPYLRSTAMHVAVAAGLHVGAVALLRALRQPGARAREA
jgi:hypothetical protein